MANWAIVIGVDRYWSEAACLQGRRRDALAVREWLLDPAGGDVPAENPVAALLRGGKPDRSTPELGAITATKANIIVAINDLIQLSGAKGERLYFYFAGHGLTTRVSNRDESARARDRLHAGRHRPLDRAALAVGVLRDDAVR